MHSQATPLLPKPSAAPALEASLPQTFPWPLLRRCMLHVAQEIFSKFSRVFSAAVGGRERGEDTEDRRVCLCFSCQIPGSGIADRRCSCSWHCEAARSSVVLSLWAGVHTSRHAEPRAHLSWGLPQRAAGWPDCPGDQRGQEGLGSRADALREDCLPRSGRELLRQPDGRSCTGDPRHVALGRLGRRAPQQSWQCGLWQMGRPVLQGHQPAGTRPTGQAPAGSSFSSRALDTVQATVHESSGPGFRPRPCPHAVLGWAAGAAEGRVAGGHLEPRALPTPQPALAPVTGSPPWGSGHGGALLRCDLIRQLLFPGRVPPRGWGRTCHAGGAGRSP